jgi:hypothetical protein
MAGLVAQTKAIKHLPSGSLASLSTTSLRLLMYKPTPPPLIDASEAHAHLREHRRVRGTVTGIETNRRGDVILRVGSSHELFKAIVPASCDLAKEHEWIYSLKCR